MFYKLYQNLLTSGIFSIPCNLKKVPIVGKWREDGIKYNEHQWEKASYIALRCGRVGLDGSESYLEIIDFDKKYGETFTLWKILVDEIFPGLYKKLYIEESPSGGMHVAYITGIRMGNKKLAFNIIDGKRVCPIETRGDGGYCVVSPSDKYKKIQGELTDLTFLSDLERECLIQVSRSFNKVPEKPVRSVGKYIGNKGDDAIENFNNQYDVLLLLEKHGWKIVNCKGEVSYLLRPGGSSAHSATFNYAGHRILYVFSGNASPFESERGYTVFGIYSLLEHGGDNKAAFRAIKGMGYGSELPPLIGIDIKDTRDGVKEDQKGNGVGLKGESVIKIEKIAYAQLVCGVELNEIPFGEISMAVNGIGIDIIKEIFKRVYKEKALFFGFNKKTTQAKAEILINDRYKLFKNIVTGDLYYKNGSDDLEKTNSTEIWGDIGRIIDIRRDVVRCLCELKTVVKQYDPFLEYFEKIKWDGIDEISKFTKYISVNEQQFHDNQLLNLFIRCIHCMLGRGENRFVWAYVGGQYIGKSYLIRFFCPPSLKEYYTEERPTSDKDCALRLQENGFYNWEELQSASNFEINQMKATIGKSMNKIRRPYETHEESKPRRANFFGSTNDAEFLTDDENTRWLPFTVKKIDHRYSKEVNIDNCYAQAYALYKSGYNFSITQGDLKDQHEVTDNYRFMTAEEELILEYFPRIDPEGTKDGIYLSAVQIQDKLNVQMNKGIRITKEKIGRVLSKKKYFKRRREGSGVTEYFVEDNTSAGQSSNPYGNKTAPHDLGRISVNEKVEDTILPF